MRARPGVCNLSPGYDDRTFPQILHQMTGRFAASLVVLALLLSGCLGSDGSPVTRQKGTDPGTETGPGNRSALDRELNLSNIEESFPVHASWTEEDLEGNISVQVQVEPRREAVCGLLYSASGSTEDDRVAMLARDTLGGGEGRAVVGDLHVEAAGDRAEVMLGEGRWALRVPSQAQAHEAFEVFLSVFDADGGAYERFPAVSLDIGCTEPFNLSVAAGTRETFPVGSGNVDGLAGASALGARTSLADGRTWHQSSNRTVVWLQEINRTADGTHRGQLEVSTPGNDTSRTLDGGSIETVWLEAGPGTYRFDVQEVAVDTQIIGTVAGLNPIGTSLEDLAAWTDQNGGAAER